MSLTDPSEGCRWPVADERVTHESKLDTEWRPRERPTGILGITQEAPPVSSGLSELGCTPGLALGRGRSTRVFFGVLVLFG